jgi:outer membrane lipoprotein LolB
MLPYAPLTPGAIRDKARARPSSPWRAASGAWLLTLTACATAPMDTPENLVEAPSTVDHAASDPAQASTSPPSSPAPAPTPEPTPAQRASEVTGQWEGRLSLKLGAFGAASSSGSQMSFELDVKGSQGTLSLSTPLGTRMAMVRWLEQAAPGQTTAQLETSDGIQAFDSLEALTQQLLGEALPLQAMLHWLRGHPSPSLPYEPAQGQALTEPRSFTQAGWQVDATSLQEGKLNAFRAETATQRSVMLRLRLDL